MQSDAGLAVEDGSRRRQPDSEGGKQHDGHRHDEAEQGDHERINRLRFGAGRVGSHFFGKDELRRAKFARTNAAKGSFIDGGDFHHGQALKAQIEEFVDRESGATFGHANDKRVGLGICHDLAELWEAAQMRDDNAAAYGDFVAHVVDVTRNAEAELGTVV